MDRPEIERRYLDTRDGMRLHVASSGDGPPLLLLHGFTGSSETWTPFRAPFGAAHRVIALDLPGHGRSSAPAEPESYALDRFARDLALVLDELGVDRVALLGYSMGGRAAIRFAVSHGDRVAALVLESTSPGISDPARRKERLAADAVLAAAIECDGVEAFVARWESLPLWDSQRSLSSAVRAQLHAERLANSPAGLANSLRGAGAGADIAVHDLLREIDAPALVIAGALDVQYVEFGRRLQASLPDARMTIIPEAGHAVHLEQPQALTDATISFLRQVPSVSGRWT